MRDCTVQMQRLMREAQLAENIGKMRAHEDKMDELKEREEIF